ncbi:Thioesterase superfamily [Pararhodospirillum photometricum DSM 122]|uniref:Thioesterase superfamily n=1 Tax=Pararhodospirillum photometricum DSM 122 TaxID=1150469 RepID=H6SRI4_PARPM|nr:Thioesterase superfamily [Pararhodospirillum photometricum DSM 122]
MARRGQGTLVAGAGGCIVQFRRPLRPFQRFVLKSRMLSWDDKWVYIDHRVESEGALVCYAMVRGAFVGRGGVIPPAEVVARTAFTGPTPPLPPWAQAWPTADTAPRPLLREAS